MKKWNLKIELKSDFCTATGEGMPGIINVKTALEYGVPYIPAKRIKGCLLEAGHEMADNGVISKIELNRIFGMPGLDRAEGIYVKNAHLHSAPGHLFGLADQESFTIEDYEQFQKAVWESTEVEEIFLEEVFTSKRTRTAIETEYGTAEDHTLRTIQTVPAGIVFTARIEGALSKGEEKALILCAKGLRHMGIGITRGLGEVRCVLEEALGEENCSESASAKRKEKELLKEFLPEEEVTLPYEIRLESPVVVEGDSGEAGDCLPGAAISGALAGMFIRKYSLGSDAHKNEAFSRIFLRDGVQFGYGFLKRGDKEYVPCPKAVAVSKEDHKCWFNIGQKEDGKRRKALHRQVFFEGNQLHAAAPQKEIHFHHARPTDRGIAHALNDRAEDTSVPTGQFFQYIALSKGQTFAGTLKGKAKDIEKLAECLKDNDYRLRLGRSRTAEYGDCTIRLEAVSREKTKKDTPYYSKEWLMWLLTPMLPIGMENGEYTSVKEAFKKEIEEALGCSIKEIHYIACDYSVFQGYNSKWRLPTIPHTTLAAGSAFKLEINGDKGVSSSDLEGQRWGMMTGKGCGQIKAEPWDYIKEGIVVEDSDAGDHGVPRPKERKPADSVFAQILSYHEEKMKYAEYSIEELDGIQKEELPPSSSIAMLLQMLHSQKGNDGFYKEIKIQAEKIRSQNKKDRVMRLIEPCKDKTYEYMKLYLENAKWKARSRDKDD